MKRRVLLVVILFTSVFYVNAQRSLEEYSKCLPSLQKEITSAPGLQQNITLTLIVANVDSVLDFCKKNNIKVSSVYLPTRTILVTCTYYTFNKLLLTHPLVLFADKQQMAKEESAINGFDNSFNKINTAHRYWPAINGSGIIVSVKENKPDTTDIDFAGRYLSASISSTTYTNTHSTVMATIIAGGGNSNYTAKGAAWGTTISSSSFSSLLPDADAVYQQYKISIQNHSYGTAIENYYGAESAAYDKSVNNNSALIHVFSAGNKGLDAGTGNYVGIAKFANLTGNAKMAKNVLTVGAVNGLGELEDLSSRGPAYDGRVKPELVAFGEDGSSGAAALVSGVATLLQHKYKQQNANILPSSSLVKAVLINSADDVGPVGIDFLSGYGNVNAFRALSAVSENRFFEGAIAPGATKSFFITVPPNIGQLKATLVWNDTSATVNTPKALVNDLNLEIIQTTTPNSWRPWVLNNFPQIDSLNQLPRRKIDNLNTIEQITINNPVAGTYEIKTNNNTTSAGAQAFSIAYQLDTLNRFTWIFPVKNDNVRAGKRNLLRWENSFSANQPATIEININNNWQPLANNIDLAKGYYEWQAPAQTNQTQIRMTVAGRVFVSDTFGISGTTTTGVGFVCTDSVMIYWNKIPGISQYKVFELGNQYLQLKQIVNDTFLILQKNNSSSLFYSVAPVITATVTGEKANAFNYNTQGVDCYVKSFLADAIDNKGLLQLVLGTNYQVKSISFEKLVKGLYTTLETTSIVSSNTFNYEDRAFLIGPNNYRAKIVLQNGRAVYSQPQTIIGFGIGNYLVYPNFLTAGQPVVVVSKVIGNNSIIVTDLFGRVVLNKTLRTLKEQVYLPVVSKGVYFYTIIRDNKKELVGRFIIQ